VFLRPLYRRPVTDKVTAESIIFITWAFYITIIKNSLLDTFLNFDDAGEAIVQSGKFDTPLPVIDLAINELLTVELDSGLNTAFDFYTPSLEFFTLVEIFNFDLTDEINLSGLGSLPEIGIPDFNLDNAAHKNSLKDLIESEYEIPVSSDWDIGLFLPEIFSLLNDDFRVDDYLPQFQILLGLPYVPRMDEIRSDLKSLFGASSGLKGALNYIESTRLTPFFNGFSGQHSSEPFLLSGEYFQESKEVQINFVIEAEKNIDLSVDLENLFPDRFRELGISFDDTLAVTTTLALSFDFFFTVSGEDILFEVRSSSVTVRANEDIDGLTVSVEAIPESSFGISEGRFDFDSRIELVFHGLDPPAVNSSGTLFIELPITSANPFDPALYISIQTQNIFDPSALSLSAHLILAPEDPNQPIGIGSGSSADYTLDQAALDFFDAFDTVTVGQPEGSHVVEIGSPGESIYFGQPLTISNPAEGGEVFIQGSILSEGDLTINGSGHTTRIGGGTLDADDDSLVTGTYTETTSGGITYITVSGYKESPSELIL